MAGPRLQCLQKKILIPQNFEEYVVTAPRTNCQFLLKRKRKEEFCTQHIHKSFHPGAVTTYSSKF